MGLGESAAGSLVVLGLIVIGLASIVVVLVGLVLRLRTGSWRSSVVLWAVTLTLVLVGGTWHYVSPSEQERRRAEALRDSVAAAAGTALGEGSLYVGVRRRDCAANGARNRGWVAQGYGTTSNPAASIDAFADAVAGQGLSVTDRGEQVSELASHRWLLAADGERSVLIEAWNYGSLLVLAEDGCPSIDPPRE